MSTCPECGAEQLEEGRFCASCGARLAADPAATQLLPDVPPHDAAATRRLVEPRPAPADDDPSASFMRALGGGLRGRKLAAYTALVIAGTASLTLLALHGSRTRREEANAPGEGSRATAPTGDTSIAQPPSGRPGERGVYSVRGPSPDQALLESRARRAAAMHARAQGSGHAGPLGTDLADPAFDPSADPATRIPTDPSGGPGAIAPEPSNGAASGSAYDEILGRAAAAKRASTATPAASGAARAPLDDEEPKRAAGGTDKPGAASPPVFLGDDPAGEEAPPSAADLVEQRTGEAYADGLRRIVKLHGAQVSACYERAFKDEAAPRRGRVEIGFTVLDDGRAHDVKVLSNDTGKDALGACLAQRFGEWSLPRPASGALVASYPFVFSTGAR